jgi:hypothetical protein
MTFSSKGKYDSIQRLPLSTAQPVPSKAHRGNFALVSDDLIKNMVVAANAETPKGYDKRKRVSTEVCGVVLVLSDSKQVLSAVPFPALDL